MSPESTDRLKNLYAAENNPVFMTATEGGDLAAEGLIQVNPGEVSSSNPYAFRVVITESGINAIKSLSKPQADAFPSAPVATGGGGGGTPYVQNQQSAKSSKFSIDSGVAIRKISRSGNTNLKPRESEYPFNAMEIGQSFHVPVTADDAEPHKRMASNVSAANTRFEKEVVPQEIITVTRKRVTKDENGNVIIGQDGKKVYEKYQESKPRTEETRKFIARRVDQSDPQGPGVRVFRVALDF